MILQKNYVEIWCHVHFKGVLLCCTFAETKQRLSFWCNKTKRSCAQLDSKKQVIAFWDRVTTVHKGNSTPTKISTINSRQTSEMLKTSTKSMYRVLVWEIGPASNTTRCSGLSKRRLPHAWHPSQLAINLSIDNFYLRYKMASKRNKPITELDSLA